MDGSEIHNGTAWSTGDPDSETFFTDGGRVLTIVEHGEDYERRAYERAEKIQYKGKYYRKDIK